ncbi:MAG: DegT/DnrJ/EryC1/StrS family aminotransferase [Pelagibacterales bacterium]|nr:DegT/DnrJ/EryC1/StrS family aminotransferase [Pelagibacterales bacterium]
MTKYPWFKPFNTTSKLIKKIPSFLKRNKNTMNIYSQKLEDKLKKILKVKHVILTTSGTSALMMATLALGTKSKTKVICTNMTWIGSINPSFICGSDVYLVDTIPNSQKVNFAKLNNLIKKIKPDIVILVHLSGEPIFNKEFNKLKKKFKFQVIEDASQTFFIQNNKKKFIGTNFEIGCFSLSITKIINMVYGGFCSTNSSILAQKLIAIRNNGVNAEPENARLELAIQPGLNLKPSDLHSYIGLINLSQRKLILSKINEIFLIYKKKLNNKYIKLLDVRAIDFPSIYVSAFTKNRDNFYQYCKKNNLGIHLGTRCIHETRIIKKKLLSNFPNSTYLSRHLVRLPCGPGYTKKEISNAIKILNSYKIK